MKIFHKSVIATAGLLLMRSAWFRLGSSIQCECGDEHDIIALELSVSRVTGYSYQMHIMVVIKDRLIINVRRSPKEVYPYSYKDFIQKRKEDAL